MRPTMRLSLAFALLAGCASTGPQLPVTAQAIPGSDGVQRLDVHMRSFYFTPDRIVVREGEPVVLSFQNDAGILPHNFTVDLPRRKVSVSVPARQTRVVRFTPDHAGAYHFYCDEPGHAKRGMTGTLDVIQ